jgi:roadblock/LC7 domain-containing protein
LDQFATNAQETKLKELIALVEIAKAANLSEAGRLAQRTQDMEQQVATSLDQGFASAFLGVAVASSQSTGHGWVPLAPPSQWIIASGMCNLHLGYLCMYTSAHHHAHGFQLPGTWAIELVTQGVVPTQKYFYQKLC